MPERKRTVRLLDEAMADSEAAIAWYRAEADDEIAARLAQEIDVALDQIANWPFSGRAFDATLPVAPNVPVPRLLPRDVRGDRDPRRGA